MTDAEKVAIIKQMCDETDEDLISTYLDLAAQAILQKAYPYEEELPAEVPDRYVEIQLEAASYLINKRGAEGESVHLENTIHRHYTDADIPTTLLRRITPYAGVI